MFQIKYTLFQDMQSCVRSISDLNVEIPSAVYISINTSGVNAYLTVIYVLFYTKDAFVCILCTRV